MSDYSEEYNECDYAIPKFFVSSSFPKRLKKLLVSSFRDNYDNSSMTNMKVSFCLTTKQEVCEEFNIKDIFVNTEYVIYSDYEDYVDEDERDEPRIRVYVPSIIVKLNATFKNMYCVIRNISLYVGCISCDGGSTCSLDLTFCDNWYQLFNLCMCEDERQLYEFDDNLSENKMIAKICNVPLGEVLSAKKEIPKFNYPTNVCFLF